MQYTKAMIDLLKEVRRRAPAEEKPAIKLANPEVMNEVQRLYFKSKDAVLKAIVKELFDLAGSPWDQALRIPAQAEESVREGYILKSYRGVTQLLERAEQAHQASPEHSKKKVYRGQVITT